MPLSVRLKHLLKAIGRSNFVLSVIAYVGYVYSLLVGKTGQFDESCMDEFKKVIEENHGVIMVSWHGRALMLPYLGRNMPRPVKALVSPHADGAIIGKILKRYDIYPIDGSSDRRAVGAAMEIIEELKGGATVTLISDGPRGPRMRLNKSVIYFASKTGKPIVGMTYSSEKAKVINSWDAMLLPKLFKKGVVKCTKPMFVAPDVDENEVERLRKQMEDELNQLTFEADEACGLPKILPLNTIKPRRKRHWGSKCFVFIPVYRLLMTLLFPLIRATYIKKRQKNGKEPTERFNERLGNYTHERPKGKLYWFHGASVGEAISMLPLIDKLLKEDKGLHIMVTTGTLTSAEIMAKRLPERAFHQFIPFDVPKFANSLLTYFRPDAVLWFESELWPSLLYETKKYGIPLILVNGRISDKSLRNWIYVKPVSRELLSCFTLLLGQSEQDKERLQVLSSIPAQCVGNIKYAGMPLPIDEEMLKELKSAVGKRQVFLISSTHHDEEAQLAVELPRLQAAVKDILVIVVPRHPNRGAEIAEMFQEKGFKTEQRAKGGLIGADTEIYVADTIGEMGLWYKLASVSFIGGSLIPHGGQNFIEPAKDKNAVIVGPFMHNFTDMTARAKEAYALVQVNNAKEVVDEAISLLSNSEKLKKSQEAAYAWIVQEATVLDKLADVIKEELAR